MFFFYFIWSFFFLILNYTHNFIENSFLIKNSPYLIRKRTFKYISYFEKIILVLFYKKGWFENSFSNLYRKKDIIEYRRANYPMIDSFHIRHNKVYYEVKSLKKLVKQFNYIKLGKLFVNLKINKLLNFCYSNKNMFINFLVLQEILINNYNNYNNYNNFYNQNENNLIKLNRVFFIFLSQSNKKLYFFNLNKWYDWYCYNFDKNLKNLIKISNVLKKNKKNAEFRKKRLYTWIGVVLKYKKRINKINLYLFKKIKNILFFKLDLNNFVNISINKDFKKLLKYYTIKFSESSITKYINLYSLKNFNVLFLRKNRIFNKGRYSRNRQLYRTGVYWCLWLNIIMVYGLYFIFYRFSFNFGYFWWGILFLAYSTIFSRIAKYNFYNLNFLFKEFFNLINWYGYIINNFFYFLSHCVRLYIKKFSIFNKLFSFDNNLIRFYYDYYYFFFLKALNSSVFKNDNKIRYMWQGMKDKDNSIFRYKTLLHWLKEIYKIIVT